MPTNVVNLKSIKDYGVVHTEGLLLVRFPAKSGRPPQELVLTDWLIKPALGLEVARYLANWGRGRRESTRHSRRKQVNHFLWFVLHLEKLGIKRVSRVADIDSTVVGLYESWLNRALSTDENSRKPLSKNTKSQRYNVLKDMIRFWVSSDQTGDSIKEDIRVKRNPWPGRHLQTKSTEVLDPITRDLIRKACIDEITVDLKKREKAWVAANDASIELPHAAESSVTPFRSLDVKLRLVANLFDGRLPRGQDLDELPGFSRSLRAPYGTVGEVATLLHFSPRALVPYAVLLDIDTAFNAEGLLPLSWMEIGEHPLFGPERWLLAPGKNRISHATRSPSSNGARTDAAALKGRHWRSFPTGLTAIESPVNLLENVKKFSFFTRQHVAPRLRDRVFMFHVVRTNEYRSFEEVDGAAADQQWTLSLKEFIAEHNLPSFTLRSLRATSGDIVHELTGDIKAQQKALGHATPGMTFRHYRSGAAKQRDQEALGSGMAWRERYIQSEGKADTRNGALLSGDQSAATPGFGCVDPYNSPIQGQVRGRLCSAFGACPSCGLAAVNPDSPHSYGRLLQFKRRLMDARSRMHPVRFLNAWAEQLTRLDEYWLPSFTPDGRAGELLGLPPFPELE